MSRRGADAAIAKQRVRINDHFALIGEEVHANDRVTLNGKTIYIASVKTLTIMLNKPVGYVCSRNGQGSKTIYDLLPPEYRQLKSVGRLDKDSSGLLLLTNDGELANQLTHPSFAKEKVYEVEINKPLSAKHFEQITKQGVSIDGGYLSRFQLKQLGGSKQKLARPLVRNCSFLATLTEGKNRQIRHTFSALGYSVTKLHRISLGAYLLPPNLRTGQYQTV